MTAAFQVRRCEVPHDPLLSDSPWDYADCFDAVLTEPDDHTPLEWLNAAIGDGASLPGFVPEVHRRVLRFRLDADDGRSPTGLRGWRVLTASDDVVQLEADGPLMRANIIARRQTPTRKTLSTYLFYRQPRAAGVIWLFIRPLHQRVAMHLMNRAASRLTTDSVAAVARH